MKVDVREPRELTFALRRPRWAGDGFAVKVNGQVVTGVGAPGSYVEVKRTWKSGDTVALTLPKTLRLSRLPDNPKKAAVLWGPMVLAGDLGPAPRNRNDGDGDGVRAAAPIPPSLVTDRPVAEWLAPVAGKAATFRTASIARTPGSPAPAAIEFTPFFEIHRRTYGAYFDVLTASEYDAKVAEIEAEEKRRAALDAATISSLVNIDPAAEKPFNLQSEESAIVRNDGRPGRRSAKWFSYDLPVGATAAVAVVVTYNSDNRRARSFEILADGQRIGAETLPQSSVAKFYDVRYLLPPALAVAKPAITIRFQATGGNEIAPVFAVRIVRA